MSVTVKQINGDTTFLLTFAPTEDIPSSPGIQHETFTVLLDPWLSPTLVTTYFAKFAFQKRVVEPCISYLSELPEVDAIIISQSKSDHCNRETLTQLSPNAKTLIFAAPGADSKIKSWKHFDPDKVYTLEKWEDIPRKKNNTVTRIRLQPLSPYGCPGEVTITYLNAKNDLPGVHSAIGITYRAPTSLPAFGSLIRPTTLPTPPDSPTSSRSALSASSSNADCSRPSTAVSISVRRDRAVSVVFSPHGVPYSTIKPYASSHLVHEAALPLTLLLHSFDRVQNPWWLGGNISAGMPGGVEIAQNLLAKCWISAHDEAKEIGGVSTKTIVTRRYSNVDVQKIVEEGKGKTEVVALAVGEIKTLRAL